MGSTKLGALIATMVLVLAACGGSGSPTQSPPTSGGTPAGGGGGTPAAPAGGGGGGAATGGDCVAPGTNAANGSVEGSIVTTGAYPNTWTFVVGNNGVSVGGTFGVTSANNGPEANLTVDGTGNIEFGPIMPGPAGEDVANNLRQTFTGTGGHATICKTSDAASLAYTCALSVDNDVTEPTANTMLHVKGTLTIKGTIATTSGYTITC